MGFFLCLFYMFHRRYSNCRPLNSARYNRIICQTVENTSFFERLSCILHALAKGYQGNKSNFGFHVPFYEGISMTKFNNPKVKRVKSNLKYTESKLVKKDHGKRRKYQKSHYDTGITQKKVTRKEASRKDPKRKKASRKEATRKKG